jgi:hypothetical protein
MQSEGAAGGGQTGVMRSTDQLDSTMKQTEPTEASQPGRVRRDEQAVVVNVDGEADELGLLGGQLGAVLGKATLPDILQCGCAARSPQARVAQSCGQ